MEPKESKSNSHFWISIVKSLIRFGACFALFNRFQNIGWFICHRRRFRNRGRNILNMNHYLTQAFAKKLKDERNNKTHQQLRHDSVQRAELPTSSNGNRKTMYSSISKWLRS